MRHAVIGAGGVGGLLAAALARAGRDVTLVVRRGTSEVYPRSFRVESRVLGDFEVEVPVVERLTDAVDVAWVAVKADQLAQVLTAPLPASAVVPLLNGIDHVDRLRDVYGPRVIAGAIRVESERVAPGYVVQPGPFIAIDLAPPSPLRAFAEQIAGDVEAASIACSVQPSEAEILWRKLALLAPLALATTSAQAPIGGVREDEALRALLLDCAREVAAVAATRGVVVDPDGVRQALLGLPPGMRSSMQKDLAAGKTLEVDAIGGPVVRIGAERGVPTPATAELIRRVKAAAAAAG